MLSNLKSLELTLPWPPSINHYKRVGRTVLTKSGAMYQTRVNTEETKRFNYEVWMKVRGLSAAQGVKFDDTDKLALTIHLFAPDKRKRDIDNPCKVLLDSLQHAGVYKDDFNIDILIIERKEVTPPGMVKILIEAI